MIIKHSEGKINKVILSDEDKESEELKNISDEKTKELLVQSKKEQSEKVKNAN